MNRRGLEDAKLLRVREARRHGSPSITSHRSFTAKTAKNAMTIAKDIA
jgi:hypothetical protein